MGLGDAVLVVLHPPAAGAGLDRQAGGGPAAGAKKGGHSLNLKNSYFTNFSFFCLLFFLEHFMLKHIEAIFIPGQKYLGQKSRKPEILSEFKVNQLSSFLFVCVWGGGGYSGFIEVRSYSL